MNGVGTTPVMATNLWGKVESLVTLDINKYVNHEIAIQIHKCHNRYFSVKQG